MLSNRSIKAALILVFLGNGACSLYQSDGRKYLEKNAIGFSQAASANLKSCGNLPLNETWQKSSENESAIVFSNDSLDFTLRVAPRAADNGFNCIYQFASVQEMIERTDSAVELTLEQMALGLVP